MLLKRYDTALLLAILFAYIALLSSCKKCNMFLNLYSQPIWSLWFHPFMNFIVKKNDTTAILVNPSGEGATI